MTLPAEHDTRMVREHYANLAQSYDAKANQACKRAYARLVSSALQDATAVLELGAGSSPLLDLLGASRRVACDLSLDMLVRRVRSDTPSSDFAVAADGQYLPFADGAFDALFSINVLEHVPDPSALLHESARVLRPGGKFLAVTPNGDVAWLLMLLERLHLKLPEGPHLFLGMAQLTALAEDHFRVLKHQRFLAFPAGPDWWVGLADRLAAGHRGRGLFQYILLERR